MARYILIRETTNDIERRIAYMAKSDDLSELREKMKNCAEGVRKDYVGMGYDEVEAKTYDYHAVITPMPDELDGTHYFIFDTEEAPKAPWMFVTF